MQKTGQRALVGRFMMTGLVVAILIIVGRGRQAAFAADGTTDGSLSWRGIVSDKPDGGLTGEWVIEGKSFVANGDTEFNQEDGALAVGVCADVDYIVDGDVNRALEIDSKEAIECTETATVTPDPDDTPDATVTPDDDGTDDPGETPEPGETPNSDETPDPNETPEPGDTPEPGETEEPGDIPSDDDGDGHLGVHGQVTALTEVTITVEGVEFVLNGDTEREQEHGQIEVGTCVEVEYIEDGGQRIATEIKSEHDYQCNLVQEDDGVVSEGELFGVIESFPATLTGTWTIGGMQIEANAQTEFKQEDGAFAVGVTVKVHFYTDGTTNIAKEIETKFEGEEGSDDDDNGSVDGAEGQAFGQVNVFPQGVAGLVGTWTIGGVDFEATADTEFENEDGEFAVGAQVKVEFFEGTDGTLFAHKIETTNDRGETEAEEHSKFVGFVDTPPAVDSFLGTWIIGGDEFVADANTKFEEESGLLVKGAFVEVEYFTENGQRIIHKLETAMPPGAGDDNQIGEIETMGDDNGGAQVSGAALTWTVGGVVYLVTPATMMNEHEGPLEVGTGAIVNSFVDFNGANVATVIRGIGEVFEVFLPTTIR